MIRRRTDGLSKAPGGRCWVTDMSMSIEAGDPTTKKIKNLKSLKKKPERLLYDCPPSNRARAGTDPNSS